MLSLTPHALKGLGSAVAPRNPPGATKRDTHYRSDAPTMHIVTSMAVLSTVSIWNDDHARAIPVELQATFCRP